MERGRSLYKAVARIGLLGLCFLACALALPAFSPSEAQAAPPSCNTPLIGGSLKAGGSIGVLPDCSGTPTPTLSYQWQRQARIKQVSAGVSHSCAVRYDGTVWCWGRNSNGQIGNGATSTFVTAPTQVSGITNAVQVSVNGGSVVNHSCALLSTGSIQCWGNNGSGQLGNNSTVSSSTPVTVSGITTATEVSAGGSFSCARLSDSTLRCWGANSNGMLGNATTTQSSVPVTVSGISTATQVSAGNVHACARLSDSTLRCWGYNLNGQLGNNSTTQRIAPVTVSGISTATQVSATNTHSCARLSDSTLRCWGYNGYGQLGNASYNQSLVPVTVFGVSTATSVNTGANHSCARLSDSSMRCWGYSQALGNNSASDALIPVTPSGSNLVTQLSGSNGNHNCAVLLDGTVKCWGRNDYGQLGADAIKPSNASVTAPVTGFYYQQNDCYNYPGTTPAGRLLFYGAADVNSPLAAVYYCSADGQYAAGATLATYTASTNSLTPVATDSFSGAWGDVASATSSSLSLTSSDEGYAYRAQVTAANGDLPNATATSAASCSAVQSSSSTYDCAPPTASWTTPATPNNFTDQVFELSFTETVTGLTASDITVSGTATGCSVALSGSASPYRVTISGCSNGTVIPTLAANSVADSASNNGPAAAAAAPVVTINRAMTNVVATGGTITTPGDGYRYHTFLSGGTFTMTTAGPVEYLVVGGGGGGGGSGPGAPGGGGGAGGVKTGSLTLSSGSYTATVGTGGTSSTMAGGNGTGSSFSTVSVSGGGGGAITTMCTAGSGASAGGTGSGCASNGTAIAGEGNLGGSNAGGGGGKSSAGSNGSGPATGGNGGAGITALGRSVGGGGGGGGTTTPGTASNGGGGGGTAAGTAGTANSGGGGGGAGSGNGGAGGSGIVVIRYPVDTTPPTLSWSSAPSSPTNSSSLSYQLTSNETLSGFTAADLTNTGTATGCSFSISGSSSPYTVTASSCSEGTVVLRLLSGSVSDASGNTAPASNLDASSVSVDRTAPTLSWSSTPSSPTNSASLSYQLTSSETLSGFTAADLTNQGTATGCSFSITGSSSPYTVTAASCSEGTVVLRLLPGSVSDASGNTAPAANLDASSVTIDRTPPSTAWGTTPASPNNSASLIYQLNFGENVTGLTSGDFSNSGTATGCVFTPSASTGSSMTVTVSSCSEGTVVLVLGVNAVSDASGNTAPSSAMSASSVTVDRTAPTLSWSSVPSSPTNSSSLTYQLTSSETLSGFTAGDLDNTGTATGCSFSITGSSSPYTVTASSCSEGTVVLRLLSGSVSDASGNTAPASAMSASSVTIDRTAPTLSWSSTPASPTNSSTLTYQLTSSETLSGFTSADVTNQGTATGCSFAISGSSSPYTVTVTGCSEGTVVAQLSASSVSDSAGNTAPASALSASTVTVDRTAPTLSWSSVPSSPSNSSSLTYQLTSSETLSGFTSADLSNTGTATGCSFSVSGSSSPYTVTASSCSEGTVVLRLASGSVSDSAGNTAPASHLDASSVTIDRTAPTLSWSSVPSSPTNSASLSYQLTSSEALSGLTSGDLSNTGTATGCSFSVSGSNSPYTVTVSSCSEGTVVLRLASGSVSDAAGNTAPGANLDTSSVTVDRTAPSPVWGSVPSSPTSSSSLSYTLTSAESLSGVVAADFQNAGTATGCVFSPSASSGTSITVTVSSCSEGTVVLRLLSGSVSDAAGNPAPASNLDASSVTIDRTAPTISWSSVPSSPTNSSSLTYSLASSEALSGLTSGDVTNTGTATGCVISVSGSSSPYTVTVSSCSEGTVVLRLASGSVSDAAGNAAPASNLDASSVTVDRTAPTLSWSSVPSSPANNASLSYQLTSSETLSGFTSGDLTNTGTATGCSFSISGSSSPYTVTASSCSEGTVVLRLASGSVSDSAGNAAPGANLDASSVTVDRTAPTISWSSVPSSPTNSASLSYSLSSSETLSGLTSGDISNTGTATSCVISVSGSSSPYTVTVSSCSEGTVVLRLASGSVSDPAGNAAPASALDASSVTVDRTPPTITWGVTPSSPTNASALTYQINFNENVTGLTSGDFSNTGTATGCVFTPSASTGSTLSVTVSSCSEGTVVLVLGANAVSDASGNTAPSSALDASSVTVDRTAPTASFVSTPSSPSSSASLTYSLSFSESVSGFTSSDLSNTGTATGCAFSVSGSGDSYTVTASFCSEGTVVLRLASAAVSDSSSNSGPSSALDASSVTVDRTAPTASWSSVPSSPTNSSSLSYTLSFSESVTGLTGADFSNQGTATGCSFSPVSSSGSSIAVSVADCSEGTVVLRLASGSVSDTSGNTAPAANLDASSVTIDRTDPAASWTEPASPTAEATLSYGLSFSEPVSGLAAADLSNQGSATGCSFSVSGSGDNYTVEAADCSEGTVVLRLASGAVSDSAGNSSSQSDAASVTIARSAASASFTEPASPTNSASLSYGVSFSKAVTGFTAADLSNTGTATGCSFSVSGSGDSYTVEASSCSEGTVVLRLAAESVANQQGGRPAPGANADASSVTIDRTAPTASFAQEPASPTNASTLSYDLSFSESVTGLTGSDFSNQGSATGCSFTPSASSGSSISVSVTDCSEGTVILRLASGSVSDAAGNDGPASAVSASSLTVDRTSPTASFTQQPTSPTNASTLSYDLSFSEPVTGLTGGDFSNQGSATGCSFSVSGSGDTYTVTVSSCSDGTVVLRLASGSVSDAAGNSGPATHVDAASVTVDGAPATASWGEPASPTKLASLSYVLNFSKPVTGLSAGDLSNTGTASGCSFSVSGSGDSYTVTASSCSEGTVVLRLSGGSVTSQAGTASPASADLASSVTIDRTAPTASFTQVPSSPTGAESLDYQLTFSESVAGLTSGDFSNQGTATDCVFSTSAASGTVFTVNASGCSSGSLVIRLASGAVIDQASNSGPASAVSASSVTVALIPVNSDAPVVSGDAETGQMLTASSGTWNRSPSYAYQWQSSANGTSGWSDISGEILSSYTISSSQAGKYLRMKVTATNAVGSAVAYSDSTAQVIDDPQNPVAPSISGSAYPGVTLTLSTGTWTGTPTPVLSSQWQYCDAEGLNCQDIQGESSSSYTIQESDRGYRLRAQVTGVNAAGELAAFSAPTAEVTDQAPSPPVLQSEISITSSPEAGNTATTDGGAWGGYPTPTLEYQWQLCDVGGECTDVPSQQAALEAAQVAGRDKDFTPTSQRYGKQLRVRVTATNSEGAASEVSPRSNPVRARPFKISGPSFSGAAAVGQVLLANPGSWGGYPAPSFTYAWQLCDKQGANCNPLSGSAGSYRSQAGHVSKKLKFTVTATNPLGSESEESSPSSEVQGPPSNTAAPEITGTASKGGTLTVSDGSWEGTPPADKFAYQWYRCDVLLKRCPAITGATSAAYTPIAIDAGSRLRAAVTASNMRGQALAYAPATGTVVAPVEMTSGPGISGTLVVGKSLAAIVGRWSGFPAPGYQYQWQRCDTGGSDCVDLAGKTANSYTIVAADYGKRLRLKLTASNASSSETVFSTVSSPIGSPPLLEQEPAIVGEAALGETLGVDEGRWTSVVTPSYDYQWQQCNDQGSSCAPIRRATGEQFTVGAGQVGGTLKVKVVSKNHIGSASADSVASEQVEGRPTNLSAPEVSGLAQTRGVLTTSSGSWTALPAATYSYKWQRCKGVECSDIQGATNSTYTATRSDVGFRIRSQVTATNDLGSASVSSAMSAPVKVAVYSLALDVAQGGKVRLMPNGVFCQGKCRLLIPEGTQVSLSSEFQDGYDFDSFTGQTCSGRSCQFEMTADASVGVQFVRSPVLSLDYAVSSASIFLWDKVTVSLTAKVTAPTELIREQPGVRACLVVPDTLTVPSVPDRASLVGSNLCWSLGTITPPYSENLSVEMQTRNRVGQRSLSPYITALNRTSVRGVPTSGTGQVRVSVRR